MFLGAAKKALTAFTVRAWYHGREKGETKLQYLIPQAGVCYYEREDLRYTYCN